MGPLECRQIRHAEKEQGFALLMETAKWLEQKGKRQRIAKTPFATYEAWQEAGVNHGVFSEGQLVGIYSLPEEAFVDWPDFQELGKQIWLRALATHPNFRGKQVGETGISEALKQVGDRSLYLDCVSGFLPGYYQKRGFKILAEQEREYPGDGTYQITLMAHPS